MDTGFPASDEASVGVVGGSNVGKDEGTIEIVGYNDVVGFTVVVFETRIESEGAEVCKGDGAGAIAVGVIVGSFVEA